MMTSDERFLTAILTQAVEDASYEGNSKKYLKHKVSATNWIVSNDPEYQNYCKMLGDALEGILWANDSRIVDAHIVKLYCEKDMKPHINLVVTPIDKEQT